MSVNQNSLAIFPICAPNQSAGFHFAYARSMKTNFRLASLFKVVFAEKSLPPSDGAAEPISPDPRRSPTSK